MSKQTIIIDPNNQDSMRRAAESVGAHLIDLNWTAGVQLDPLKIPATDTSDRYEPAGEPSSSEHPPPSHL